MRITIDIPKEFEDHFNKDRFSDSLSRLKCDANCIAGNYERELMDMLTIAFSHASTHNEFTVVDTKTGEYPDVCKIARKEDWAKDLIYCDIDSFAIMEDGSLILTDDCGNVAYCPKDRFEIVGEE